MPLVLLLLYSVLNMFRMLIHPSSGACDLFVELFHGLYCSGSKCVGVTLWWCGIRMQAEALLQPAYGYHTTIATLQRNTDTHRTSTTHEVTQRISCKLLRMDVLTSETCWAPNKVIIKQVASSWSLFTQKLVLFVTLFQKTLHHWRQDSVTVDLCNSSVALNMKTYQAEVQVISINSDKFSKFAQVHWNDW